MSFKPIFRFRNPDSTADLNSAYSSAISKGIYNGGDITVSLNNLNITVAPFTVVGHDGLVVKTDAPVTLTAIDGKSNVVALFAKYEKNAEPLIQLRVFEECSITSSSLKDFYVVFGKVNLTGGGFTGILIESVGSPPVTKAYFSYSESHFADKTGLGLKPAVANFYSLPQVKNRKGDIRYSLFEESLYAWDVNTRTWNNILATSAIDTVYETGPSWRDGDTNPETTVQKQIDKILLDLGGIRYGVGDSITNVAPNMTLIDAEGNFLTTEVGSYITIAGANTPANNGTFFIAARPSVTAITYTNPSGVAETFTGTWSIAREGGASKISTKAYAGLPVDIPQQQSVQDVLESMVSALNNRAVLSDANTWSGTNTFTAFPTILAAGAVITELVADSNLIASVDTYTHAQFSTASLVRISTSISNPFYNINGFPASASVKRKTIHNYGGNPIILKYDACTTASNGIYTPGAIDYSLAPTESVEIVYDVAISRWILVAKSLIGKVNGAGTTTDKAIPTWNGTAGLALNDSVIRINPAGTITSSTALNLTTSSADPALAISLLPGVASGTDKAGANLNLTGGSPTGNGLPGSVIIAGADRVTGTTGGSLVVKGGSGNSALTDGVIRIDRTTANRATRLQFVAEDATTVSIKAPAAVTSYTLTLPVNDGNLSEVLTTDGSGVLSWTPVVSTVQEEGVTTSSVATTLNFTGVGVTALGTGNIVTITVPGDVAGPGSSTDNSIVTWNGITGKIVKNTDISVTSGTITGSTALNVTTISSNPALAVSIAPGSATGTNIAGASLNLTGGAPTGSGLPGSVNINGNTNTTVGSDIILTPGGGNSASNDGTVKVARVGSRASRLQFIPNTGTPTVSIKAPSAVTTSYDMVLPTAQSVGTGLLQNDGAGNLSWDSETYDAVNRISGLTTASASRMVSTAAALYEEDLWIKENALNWRSQTFSEAICFPLNPADFPHGCTITDIVASVQPNTARANVLNRMKLRLLRKDNLGNFSTIGPNTSIDGIDNGGNTQHDIFLLNVNQVLDRGLYEYFATIYSGSANSPYLDKVYSVYATRTL